MKVQDNGPLLKLLKEQGRAKTELRACWGNSSACMVGLFLRPAQGPTDRPTHRVAATRKGGMFALVVLDSAARFSWDENARSDRKKCQTLNRLSRKNGTLNKIFSETRGNRSMDRCQRQWFYA